VPRTLCSQLGSGFLPSGARARINVVDQTADHDMQKHIQHATSNMAWNCH